MTLPSPVRLVGCGSPFGDDAVGWAIVAALREALAAAAPDVELYTLATPDRLLDVLDGRGSLGVVDGLVSGAPVGTVLRFEWPDPRLQRVAGSSTHGLSVTTMLQVAERIGRIPAQVMVLGVACARTPAGPDPALSPSLAAAVPAVVTAVLAALSVPSSCARPDSDSR